MLSAHDTELSINKPPSMSCAAPSEDFLPRNPLYQLGFDPPEDTQGLTSPL